jgi:hypothetical protein
MMKQPSLPVLERLLAQHRPAEALQVALNILHAIDDRAGRIDHVITGIAHANRTEEEIALVFTTRFAAAFGRLLSEPGLDVSLTDYERLLVQYRWIDLIFSLSGFRNPDHFPFWPKMPARGN